MKIGTHPPTSSAPSARGALFCILALALLVSAISCGPPKATGLETEPLARRHGRELVLVLAPRSDTVEPTLHALRSELEDTHDVQLTWVIGDATPAQLGSIIDAANPTVVVLVDNSTVELYRNWVRSVATPPPSVLLFTSFVRHIQPTVPNSTGIAYEIPAVTALVDVRSLLDVEVSRAGVVHRRKFRAHVAQQQKLASIEKIDLVGVELRDAATASDLRGALSELQQQSVDAIWVMNDNHLLTSTMIEQAWLQRTRQWSIPVVVGVSSLVDARVHFGTYAAVPDHEALGLQAADLVDAIAERGTSAVKPTIQLPISIHTYVDLKQARALGLTPGREIEVDFTVTSR